MDVKKLASGAEKLLAQQSSGLSSCPIVRRLYEINFQLFQLLGRTGSVAAEFEKRRIAFHRVDLSTLELVLKATKFDGIGDDKLPSPQRFGRSSDYALYEYPVQYLSETDQGIIPNYLDVYKWIFANLGQGICDLLGGNFRIDNLWHYRTKNNGSITSNLNSKLHKDGDFSGALKVLIYLTDVDSNNGPFGFIDPMDANRLKLVTASQGTVIFFKATELMHCATNTISAERRTLSFNVYPWLGENCVGERLDCRPFNGLARKNPFYSDACQ